MQPGFIRTEIQSAAVQPAAWKSPVKWAEARDADRDYAAKLQSVFLPFLELHGRDPRSQAQREAGAIVAYRQVFRHTISDRWIRKLYKRIVERDGEHRDWMRLDLYLPKNVAKQPAARPDEKKFCHDDLAESLKGIIFRPSAERKQPGKLTTREKQFIWTAAYAHLAELAAPGLPEYEGAKRSVRRFLYCTFPMLAASPEAIKRNFDRKIAALEDRHGKPSAIADRREIDSGFYRGPEISQEAHKALVAWAVFNRGSRVAQAWRDYIGGHVPNITPAKELVEYYAANPASKSYVPRRVAEDVKYEVKRMEALHHSSHLFAQKAHVRMDDSKLYSGQVLSSDDTTLPVYFAVGPHTIIRGQFLMTVDRRSRRIQGHALTPNPGYTSANVHVHFTTIINTYGVPEWAEWERGLWQRSKMLKGDVNADLLPPEERELGLREIGIKFRHRVSAKAKIVEREFGSIQDLMEGEPGYCGRGEQTERFQEFHKLRIAVESGRVNAFDHFYSLEQWEARLAEICAEYNRTPQDRRSFLAGLSPDEAYEKYQNLNDPPVKLDASTRYLLSTHRRAVKVTENGIDFRCGKTRYVYRNLQTGVLVGKKVLIWFDPESPDVAYVTDLRRQNPFAVERSNALHPTDETPENIATEMRKLHEHQASTRAIYRALKSEFKPIFRRNIVSPDVVATGRAFEQGAQEIRQKRARRDGDLASLNRVSAATGIPIPRDARNVKRTLEGIQGEAEFWRERSAQSVIDDSAPVIHLEDPSSSRPVSRAVTIPSVELYRKKVALLEISKPGVNQSFVHALTKEAIGCCPLPSDMTPNQLSLIIAALDAVISEAQQAVV